MYQRPVRSMGISVRGVFDLGGRVLALLSDQLVLLLHNSLLEIVDFGLDVLRVGGSVGDFRDSLLDLIALGRLLLVIAIWQFQVPVGELLLWGRSRGVHVSAFVRQLNDCRGRDDLFTSYYSSQLSAICRFGAEEAYP